MNQYVYELLETRGKLKKVVLTYEGRGSKANNLESFNSFIFVSEDVFTNTEKLVVLIHGSGVVRAGQWARRLFNIEILPHEMTSLIANRILISTGSSSMTTWKPELNYLSSKWPEKKAMQLS